MSEKRGGRDGEEFKGSRMGDNGNKTERGLTRL